MKNRSFVLAATAGIFAIVLAACSNDQPAQTEATSMTTGAAVATPNASVTPDSLVTFSVAGMSCGGCEKSITEALHKLDGVSSASANTSASMAMAQFDSKTVAPTDMVAAINKLGFSTSESSATVVQQP
jgi:copper chaperone CopZ